MSECRVYSWVLVSGSTTGIERAGIRDAKSNSHQAGLEKQRTAPPLKVPLALSLRNTTSDLDKSKEQLILCFIHSTNSEHVPVMCQALY